MDVDETSLNLELDKTILWQYDKSQRLLALFNVLKTLASATFTDFFNNFITYILTIKNIGLQGDPFNGNGLALWGIVTGLKRPMVTVTEDGVTETRFISDSNYKKILIARMHQMYRPATLESIEQFMKDVFGNSAQVIDNNDMTISLVVQSTNQDIELAALSSSSTELMKILELPIGVGFDDIRTPPVGQFGLNITQDNGQMRENYAPSQSSSDGGGSLA